MPWTEEKVSELRELWDQGLPTSQIGRILSFTKNAVVGKAHRIGLERRPSPIKRSIMKPDRKKARAPLMPNLSISLKSDNNFEHKNKYNYYYSIDSNEKYFKKNNLIINNKSLGCEWPNGHPNEINFKYCGEEKVEGKPYCSKHCELAYIVPEKGKKDLAVA